MKIKNVTPILTVERIEDVLPFWTQSMGYEKIADVPHGKSLGFVMLTRDASQVMLQSRASIEEDVPAAAKHFGNAALYIDVDSIEDAVEASKGLEVLVPLRTTFYGAREIWVRDVSGQVFGFAENTSSGT